MSNSVRASNNESFNQMYEKLQAKYTAQENMDNKSAPSKTSKPNLYKQYAVNNNAIDGKKVNKRQSSQIQQGVSEIERQMMINQYTNQYHDLSVNSNGRLDKQKYAKEALTPTRQLLFNKIEPTTALNEYYTQDPLSPSNHLLDSAESHYQISNNLQRHNGFTSQTMNNSYKPSPFAESPQKNENLVPLTPNVQRQKRKQGLQHRQEGSNYLSSQNVDNIDNLKSIDEYKAQISSQIRIQNNQHAAVSARNDIQSNSNQNQRNSVVQDFRVLPISKSPDVSGYVSPHQQRDFQSKDFGNHVNKNHSPKNGNADSFLPVINNQQVDMALTNMNGQNRSPSKIQGAINDEEQQFQQYLDNQEGSTQGNGRAGSRLLMANPKQNNTVLRTLQQHVTQRQSSLNGGINNAQLFVNQQVPYNSQIQPQKQLLNTSTNGLKNQKNPYATGQRPQKQLQQTGLIKSSQEKQLEGLNETLQRLGREKATGKGQSNKKKKESKVANAEKMSQMNQKMLEEVYPLHNPPTINNHAQNNMNLSLIHPQGTPVEQSPKKQKDPGSPGKRKRLRDKQNPQTLENLKQKLEAQQRNNMMMNDSLGAVRLQGVTKQGNSPDKITKPQLTAQPMGIPSPSFNDQQLQQNQRQNAKIIAGGGTPQQYANQVQIKKGDSLNQNQGNKIYKLNMSQIKMKDTNLLKPASLINSSQLSQYQMNQQNTQHANIQIEDTNNQLISKQMMQMRNSQGDDYGRFRQYKQNHRPRSEDQDLIQSQYSPSVAATVLQRLQLNTKNSQFSSVIEDVEMEQQQSPSPAQINMNRERRLRGDKVRQSTIQDGVTDISQEAMMGANYHMMNNTELNSLVVQLGDDSKPQGLRLKLIGIDNDNQTQKSQNEIHQNIRQVQSPQDEDVYTRIVNKINVIIENKRQSDQSIIDEENENRFKQKMSVNQSGQQAPPGNTRLSDHAGERLLLGDTSLSAHSKRYNSHSRGRGERSNATRSKDSKLLNIVQNKLQLQGDTESISRADSSPTDILPPPNNNFSPSQTPKESMPSLSLERARQKGQRAESNQQRLRGGDDGLSASDSRSNNGRPIETVRGSKRQVQKHQTQQLGLIGNDSEDEQREKKFQLPTIESKATRKGGTLASDSGSAAPLRRHQSRESQQRGRLSQNQLVKPRAAKSSTRNGAPSHQGTKGQPQKDLSKRPPLSQNKGLAPSPKKTGRQGRAGHSSMVAQIQKNQNLNRQPSVQSIEGYESSDAQESVTAIRLGWKLPREGRSSCVEYIQHKGCQKLPKSVRNLFTPRSLKQGDGSFAWSQRLFMSKECATSEERRMLPIIIINLDGAFGHWDDSKKNYYLLRPKALEGLIQLSYDFRLVAVSSQRQKLINKLIYGLINVPGDSHGSEGSIGSKGLVFDAVYQLATENEDNKFCSFRKNIDEIHFDLSQVLIDMHFSKPKPPPIFGATPKHAFEAPKAEKFQTFWETDSYRPHKKVIILTTNTYHHSGTCYSFDYNYLYQASKYKHEESKKAPIVIQLPHLRNQPRLSFETTLQIIFTLQSIAYSVSCGKQPGAKRFEGSIHQNPDFSSFEMCKKYLCSKWRLMDTKMKKESNVKGLRIFDQKQDPFVDLELLDFGEAYKFLKKHFAERKSDWLKLKKYYLKLTPMETQLSSLKIKQNLKVTFNESPEIRRIGEDRDKAGSRAAATTHDSSKSDRISAVKNQYISEEAKNLYNGLMIRNYKIQQEVNSYARHFRIQNQRKIAAKKKQEQDQLAEEELQSPIVIYDGDKEKKKSALRSSLKQSSQKSPEPPKKVKEYALKYRVIKVRSGEQPDEASHIDISRYQAINLKSKYSYFMCSIRNAAQDKQFTNQASQAHNQTFSAAEQQSFIQSHTSKEIQECLDPKNYLIELLSKRQTRISYSTNQEMHLKNNLNQLVDGEQQYKEQQKELTEAEKQVKEYEQDVSRKDTRKESQLDYLDNL